MKELIDSEVFVISGGDTRIFEQLFEHLCKYHPEAFSCFSSPTVRTNITFPVMQYRESGIDTGQKRECQKDLFVNDFLI